MVVESVGLCGCGLKQHSFFGRSLKQQCRFCGRTIKQHRQQCRFLWSQYKAT